MVLKVTAQQQEDSLNDDLMAFDSAMVDDEGFLVYEEDEGPSSSDEGEAKDMMPSEDEEGMMVVELEGPGGDELIFSLPFVPGADDDSEIIVSDEDELEVDEPEDVEVAEKDKWDWQSGGLGNFLVWLHGMMNGVPRHTGRDTTGLEKAISYFEALDKEITKAMRSDYRDEINSAKAEEARAQIEQGLERLVERLDSVKTTKYKRHAKKKKKAEEQALLVKEAQKVTGVHGVIVTVPLLISRIARVCINGTVSAGHDIEDLFAKQAEMYSLTNREKAEVVQLLEDMGYPIRRDRMHPFDETYDPKRSDNGDWAANYPG